MAIHSVISIRSATYRPRDKDLADKQQLPSFWRVERVLNLERSKFESLAYSALCLRRS